MRLLAQRMRIALPRWPWFWILVIGCVFVLGDLNGLGRLDNAMVDHLAALNTRPAPSDIVIVAIDDVSLDRIGRWPWRRSVHAALLDRMRAEKPRAVGIDLILSEADLLQPADDRQLGEALLALGRVVLPVRMERQGHADPAPVFATGAIAQGAQGFGHIHIELDRDGIARSVFLREGLAPNWWSHMSLALLDVAGMSIPPAQWMGKRRPDEAACCGSDLSAFWSRDYQIQIPYAGPPGHFQRVSYADVLAGRLPAGFLRDKFVLIGVTAPGLGDAYPTPIASQNALMPGVEIIANVLDSLQRGVHLRKAEAWENALFCALPVLIALLALYSIRSRWALLTMALLMAATYLAAGWAQRLFGVQFAPLAAFVGIGAVYPLWVWRRLEFALSYLAAELVRIRREDKLLATAPLSRVPGDELDRRIDAMSDAIEQLRDLQRFVRDSMNSLDYAVLVTDISGAVLLTNPAAQRYFETTSPGVEQHVQPVLDSLSPVSDADALPDLTKPFRQVREYRVTDASHKDLLLKIIPRRNHVGEQIGWIFSFVDISRLLRAQRQREEALHFLSHDMRSPQSSILALIELHRRDHADASHPLLDRIAAHASRTLALADDFVHLVRAQSSDYTLDTLDLIDVVFDAADQFWDRASASGARIETEVPDSPAWCWADRSILTRAVANLIDNALKYGPPKGVVRCVLTRQGDDWALCVHDEGPGIDAAKQGAMLAHFKRVSRADGLPSDGVGLGLAFVEVAVRRHQGYMDIHAFPAASSAFCLILPGLFESPASPNP